MNIVSTVSCFLWGNLSREEYKKFGLLAATLLFIVGTYWLLRPIKDALFANTVGSLYLPYAKVVSAIFLIPIILLYSKLVDIFEKQQLFYIIAPCYGVFFLCIAYFLANSVAELGNPVPCRYQILGWTVYLGVESFILLVISLFWSFVASTTGTASAKRGYALIFAGAQIGTIIGPEFSKHATQVGIPLLLFIAACGIFTIPLMIMLFVKLHPQVLDAAAQEIKTPTGFTEGLRLLFTRPYLIGILGIATLGCIVSTILEFALIYRAKETFHSTEKIIEFLGLYGQSANILTLFLALFGTSFIIRKFGLTLSLVAYSVTVGVVVYAVWCSPTLWVLFTAMVTIKCLSYGLNGPCKEIAYIPTSKDVKFKAKGWIDTIGYRSAESIGGAVGVFFPVITNLIFFGSIISFGVVILWIIAGIYVGMKNTQLLKENKIIE
jgi:ATP:ADP antiporter, AAA family